VYLFAISEARVWHNDASAVSGVGCWVFELFLRLCSGNPLSVCVFDCVRVCFLVVFAFLYDCGALVGFLAAGGGGVLMWSEDPNSVQGSPLELSMLLTRQRGQLT
jgi:hypothetical protein